MDRLFRCIFYGLADFSCLKLPFLIYHMLILMTLSWSYKFLYGWTSIWHTLYSQRGGKLSVSLNSLHQLFYHSYCCKQLFLTIFICLPSLSCYAVLYSVIEPFCNWYFLLMNVIIQKSFLIAFNLLFDKPNRLNSLNLSLQVFFCSLCIILCLSLSLLHSLSMIFNTGICMKYS